MSSIDAHRDRILAVLSTPPELTAYREWLAGHDTTTPRDYLFTEKRTRFEPRREDVVVALDGLSVIAAKGTTVVRCADRAITIPVPDVSPDDARRVLEHVDGQRCLLGVQLDAGVSPLVLALMLRATFGRVIMAPDAVGELEAEISGLEIARFPAPPYTITRPYWRNMAAVRRRLQGGLPEEAGFVSWLRELHVVAMMGEHLDSFYKPASPGADVSVAPGVLFAEAVHLAESKHGVIFLSGPRVNAKFIGGEPYHEAIYRSLEDPAALTRDHELNADGEGWGRVVMARSERDPEAGPWFCPPRPLSEGHFAVLHRHLGEAWAQADASDGAEAAVAAVARFHWGFVRLHPFHCGNQSLAMNLANAVLNRTMGAGIPHLVLDHFALRLQRDAYVELFARAVRAFVATGDPVSRVSTLMATNERSYAFIAKLNTASLATLVADDPEAAQAALLA